MIIREFLNYYYLILQDYGLFEHDTFLPQEQSSFRKLFINFWRIFEKAHFAFILCVDCVRSYKRKVTQFFNHMIILLVSWNQILFRFNFLSPPNAPIEIDL